MFSDKTNCSEDLDPQAKCEENKEYMFIILSYDVNKKRVGKVLKTCRKYLCHIQKSVFEGNITEGKLDKLKSELERIIDTDEDAVCIYRIESLKYTRKEQIGVVEQKSNII